MYYRIVKGGGYELMSLFAQELGLFERAFFSAMADGLERWLGELEAVDG